MKKSIIIFSLIFILFISSTFIGAFLTDTASDNKNIEVGHVEVDLNAYFIKNNIQYTKSDGIEAILYGSGSNTVYKKGVYALNITESSHRQFIENFRVEFNVKSSVDTYFRVGFYQSKILRLTNASGLISENVLIGTFPLNTSPEFYLHTDGYYYYMNPIKAINNTTSNDVTFIGSYFNGVTFSTAPVGQELQVTFKIEAVQSVLGAQNNWGLETKPWGGNW